MLGKPELTQELSTFLELLHHDDGYENYLMDDTPKKNKDLSIIYSQPESEVSTQRDSCFSIGDHFALLFKDLDTQQYAQLTHHLKTLQQQIHNYMLKVSEKINELSQQNQELLTRNQSYETNNNLLVDAINLLKNELQSHLENSTKLKKTITDLKKQNEELNKSLIFTSQVNQTLQQQIERDQLNYRKNEEEFRDASQRLIKSNQALREIIANIGSISPLHKNKLQEVIKYLTEGQENNKSRSGRSQSKKQKENCSIHYSTLNINTSRTKKSMSPQGYQSNRKGILMDTNYQTSYKELFLKSLKVSKQK